MDNFRRRVECKENSAPGRSIVNGYEVVDLGLPSGILWTTWNIGATSETDRGYFFSWGNINGYPFGTNYQFSETNYRYTSGYNLTGDIPVNDTYDIAQKVMGSSWRLPTIDEFMELWDHTDHEWVSKYNDTNINGYKFMKKSNHSVYAFISANGAYFDSGRGGGSAGYYWSSTLYAGIYAYSTIFSSETRHYSEMNRNYGFQGRAVLQLT